MNGKRIAIIGGGIGGLSAGFFLKQKLGEQVELTIYEKEDRSGGTIGVTREDGYIADWGPNGFLDREPLTLEFIHQAGLDDLLLPSNKKSETRFIYRNGQLWEISANPVKFLSSGLLSLKGRLRIGLEYFIRKKTDGNDETIFDFVSRRIGREAAEILIDPMVSGIFGGDARQLSLGACFPIMETMEQEHGGLIRAMIKKKKAAGKRGKKAGPAGPAGHLTSFCGGLFTLVERLGELLNGNIALSSEIKSIEMDDSGRYRLYMNNGDYEIYDYLILATPSFVSGLILQNIAPDASSLLKQIPYANLAVVCQGYKLSDIGRPVDGFGFLVPHNQNLDILGSIWTSIIFPEQAPKDAVLFRTMLGGARRNEIIELGENRLAELSHNNLATIMNIKNRPVFEKVIIWRNAIPQYTVGHRSRLSQIEHQLQPHANIHLAGNAYTGIGLNDTIKRSYHISEIISKSILL
jgi:oxygen-dependent protoporphyrinogen oxidase